MSIKSKVEKMHVESDYPKLMVNKKHGFVVLAHCEKEGFIHGVVIHGHLNGNTDKGAGYYSQSFNRQFMTDFNGSITLSNEV